MVPNSYGACICKGRIPPAGNIQLVARIERPRNPGAAFPHFAPLDAGYGLLTRFRHPEALAKRASKGDGPGVADHPSRRGLRPLLRMTVNDRCCPHHSAAIVDKWSQSRFSWLVPRAITCVGRPPIDGEVYFRACCRVIELNLLRAGWSAIPATIVNLL